MIKTRIRLLAILTTGYTGLLISGCTKDQVYRLTYETLRQEDCHRNSFRTDYCDRSYAMEYVEYKQLRNHYLQQIDEENLAFSSIEPLNETNE